MTDKEFSKYVSCIMSMSVDALNGEITQETFAANLKRIAKIIEDRKDEENEYDKNRRLPA